MYLAFLIFLLLLSPGRPTAANNGQRRPTKANEDKKGPNDASGVVWALGVFLFHFFYFILITTRHESPRQPMTANEGQRRPTQVNEGPQQPMTANEGQRRQKGPKQRVWRRLGPRCVSFPCFLFYSYYYETRKPTAANDSQQRPTMAHSSQRRSTKAHSSQ